MYAHFYLLYLLVLLLLSVLNIDGEEKSNILIYIHIYNSQDENTNN